MGDIAADELSLALDPVKFARLRLGFRPDAHQETILRKRTRLGLLNCTRQWGKSTITAALAVHRAMYEAGSLIVVLSPSARQSGEFVKKAEDFVRLLKVRPRGDGHNDISVLFPNGSRIVGLPGTEGTVRGFSAVSLLLIDEAARVPDESFQAVNPMRAVGDGDIWLMSTPHGKRGFFWDLWENGGPEWARVSVPATECPRISGRFLEEQRRILGDRVFRQEYLCEFGAAEDSVFDRDLIEAAMDWGIEPLLGRRG